MTEGELGMMRHMYELGMTAEAISRRLYLSKGYVCQVIRNNRDIFPYRNRHYDEDCKRVVVSMVLDDGMTMKSVSRKMGIHINTVARWVRMERSRRAET